jgi:molecular chaperone HtpG
VIANLAHIIKAGSDDMLVNATIEQLFGNALLLEGIHPNPAEMVEHIQKLMETAFSERARS